MGSVAAIKKWIVVTLITWVMAGNLSAQNDFRESPINYDTEKPSDDFFKLAERVKDGKSQLKWDDQHGWLPSLLESLKIPRSSQTLVFTKTSQQLRKINPTAPRAIYFSDDIYIGWVQQGDFVEVGAVDPKLGAVFYTVEQTKTSKPIIKRDLNQCMACHANSKTQDVPGFVVRSVFPKKSGHPDFRLGTLPTDHRTPFVDRFGGWYVTGNHGKMRHRGNAILKENSGDSSSTDPIERETGANCLKLPNRVTTERYLEATSDIVALMVLEHQTQMHNRVTKATYTCRQAIAYQAQMNSILERDPAYQSDSTKRRLASAANELVDYLFFVDEFQLSAKVSGNSSFQKDFESRRISDSKNRSLRDLDLKTRLLKYPCSYLVYSESFKSMPRTIRKLVQQRMLDVLTGKEQSEKYQHLSAKDRNAILEILTETHPMFQQESKSATRKTGNSKTGNSKTGNSKTGNSKTGK